VLAAQPQTSSNPQLAIASGNAAPPSMQNSDVSLQFAAVSYYACEQLGDCESQSGNLHAVENYTNALDWIPLVENA
jgi:hypothetical protein